MIVTDAGPLNFLIRIEAATALPTLYGEVVVPYEVWKELSHPATPVQVRDFLLHPPAWLVIMPPQPQVVLQGSLHAGELSALMQAAKMQGAPVLMDDLAARAEAARRGIPTIGTLALLYDAGLAGLLDFELSLSRLVPLKFRISERLRATYVEKWRQFKSS